MKRKDIRPEPYVKQLCCDRCGREAEIYDTDCEFPEFMSFDNKAGYGSIFGDGNLVEIDLCQHCIKAVLGPWLRVRDPYVGFKPGIHGGKFPNQKHLKDPRAE